MFGLTRNKKSNKAVVIGLDGVAHSLLADYMARGIMPEFSKLCGKGKLSRMESSLPEVSSVAWTSFMTGKNPGEHGIYGFMEIDTHSYKYLFPNYGSLKVRPFWEREDIKTVALNIPQTYPAKPMNGVLVSGFVALDLRKATYPERVYDYLKKIDYRLDVKTKLAQQSPEAFFEDMFSTFEKRMEAIKYLYDHEDWRLFIGTVTETDRLHHFFYDSAREGLHFEVFERFYRALDRFLKEMAERAERDGALFLTCSDHGFAPIKSEVYLSRWLEENGYLDLTGEQGLKGIDSKTSAFCLDPSRIYIHSAQRYANGGVGSSEYPGLIRDLKEKLSTITFEGEPVIKRVYQREEIFHGNLLDSAPDLYLLPHSGFDLKASLDRKAVFSTSRFHGMHTHDDAHLFVSDSDCGEAACIEGVAEIILRGLRR